MHFEPLAGEVSYWPFPELASVAWRARLILTGQTREEIHDLANHVHDLVAEYFAEARQDEVSRLAAAGLDEFLDIDEHGNILGLHFDRTDELDFPKPENTREFEALEASIDRWQQIFGEGDPVPDLGACLATLALCHVSDAIRRLQYEYDFDRLEYVRRRAKSLTAHDCIVAGQSALEALEVVCRSEQHIQRQQLQERFAEQLDAVKRQTSAEAQSAQDRKWRALQEEEARKKSEHARQLAALRLASRNASRKAVLAEWNRDPQLQQMSDAKAGLRLSQWLASQDLERFEPRTIAQWISCCKKTTLQRR
ncbi:MAG: hypothetical protein HT579_22080 [Candidatus Accumulibacter similis]|nr:MAG: hypothetical protein HT579_22080 [Candidatus Accumulibacter similis]